MAFALPNGSNRVRPSCLKSFFIIMLVWLLGLLMGSYLQVSHIGWLQDSLLSVPVSYRRSESDMTLEDYRTRYRMSAHSLREKLVNSSALCPFPVLDPFDPKILKFVKKYPTLSCAGSIPSIISVAGNELVIDPAKVKRKLHMSSIDGCVFREINRIPGKDFGAHYGKWSERFSSSVRLEDGIENVQVDCHHREVLVARSYLPLIRKKEETERKRLEDYQKHLKENSPKETLSVIIIGIDGTSKQNFVRSMPKTREFILKELNAIELQKHNKVGLNTFPNIFPLLTGKHVTEVKEWNYSMPLDLIDHMFLWSAYQKAGYRTALLTDMVFITAFHYLKKGWRYPAFDFYPRPTTVASQSDKSVYRKKGNDCMGDTPEVIVLNDYWLQLATAYNNSPSTPYFAFSFSARLTHDNQNKASAGDELYLKFFQDAKKSNVLDNTLLVLFSDHGERYGTIRNTYNGIIEAKTPLFFFMFPPWFERKYPDLISNFRLNSNRLTTHFDVFATLKDLLTLNETRRQHSPSDRSISLFSEIPANRTCSDAGIPVKYCACTQISRENFTSPEISKRMVSKFMEHILSLTNKYRDRCEILKLNHTKSILSVTPEISFSDKTLSLYHVTIQTDPGGAVYEATLTYKSNTKAVQIHGDVSRLNMYRGQAECINDSRLRSFCYCKRKPTG